MKFNVKNLFMGVILIIVLAVVFLRGDQLVELGETMKQGSPLPLVAAILTQLCKYFAQSFAYSRSFAAVGEYMEPKSTLPLVFGTFFHEHHRAVHEPGGHHAGGGRCAPARHSRR